MMLKERDERGGLAGEADPEFTTHLMNAMSKLVVLLRSEAQGSKPGDTLTPQQLGMLYLVRTGPLPISRIARMQGITRAAAGIQANRLVARGLLKKVANPGDGRSVLLTSTPKGRRVHGAAHQRNLDFLTRVSRLLNKEEQRHLGLGMEALDRVLGEELSAPVPLAPRT